MMTERSSTQMTELLLVQMWKRTYPGCWADVSGQLWGAALFHPDSSLSNDLFMLSLVARTFDTMEKQP